jgi:hypothetical protein
MVLIDDIISGNFLVQQISLFGQTFERFPTRADVQATFDIVALSNVQTAQ